MARALLERETLDGEDVTMIMKGGELAPLGEAPEPTRASINLDEDDAADEEARDADPTDTVGGDDPSPQPN